MHRIRTLADRLIGLSALVGALGLAVEVCVILTDVIGRAFGHPIYGSQDLITMTMVVTVFGAMALCDRRGGHISVDVLERHMPDGFNRAVDVLSALIGTAIFLVLAWAVYDSAQISRMLNLSTNLLRIPKAWFQIAMCAFSLLTALGMFLRAVELALGRDVRRDEIGRT